MVAFFSTLLRLFFQVFRSRRTILSEIALLKKENEILLRKMGKKKVHFGFYDKLFLVVLNRAADIKRQLTLVEPETILSWQRNLIKRFWTFEHSPAKRGRKPVDTDVKDLILSMKNDNFLWGVKRIQGELLKLGISLSTKTIRKSFKPSGAEGRFGSLSLGRGFWKRRYSSYMRWTFSRSTLCWGNGSMSSRQCPTKHGRLCSSPSQRIPPGNLCGSS